MRLTGDQVPGDLHKTFHPLESSLDPAETNIGELERDRSLRSLIQVVLVLAVAVIVAGCGSTSSPCATACQRCEFR